MLGGKRNSTTYSFHLFSIYSLYLLQQPTPEGRNKPTLVSLYMVASINTSNHATGSRYQLSTHRWPYSAKYEKWYQASPLYWR